MDMKTAVMIPSRQRPEKVERLLPKWRATGARIRIYVEPQELGDYGPLASDDGTVFISSLPMNDQGIGYARNWMLEDALARGFDYVVMCDDDQIVPPNLMDLVTVARELDLVGVGGWHRIYDHFLGIEEGTGVWATTGGMGTQCFALDVQRAAAVGGFDERLKTNLEDSDLILRLIAAGHGPWAIHSGVSLGAHGTRYQPGGIASLMDEETRTANLRRCVEILQEKHPGIVSMTAKGNSRISWLKQYARAGMTKEETRRRLM